MKSPRIFDRRLGSVGASVVMLLGILVPGLIPMAASAATLTSRSIAMSSSAAGATGAEYTVNFTTTQSTEGIVVDFCTTSPFTNDTCDAPGSMSIPATPTVTFSAGTIGTVAATGSANHLAVQGDTPHAAGATTFTVAGITNPASTGVVYARVYTYSGTIDYTDATHAGTVKDEGGMALDYTMAVGVTAAVREKLIFCVSKLAPGPSCGLSGQAVTDPSLTLGQGDPSSLALDSAVASTGDDYSQLSTNAAGGAVVNIKNSNSCNGLHRSSQSDAATCEIAGAGSAAASITGGSALFGVRLGTETQDSGNYTPVAAYSDATTTKYAMSDDTIGTYGDALYSTSGPASNVAVPMTFAASISNDTPAGIYSATISLIATGTF